MSLVQTLKQLKLQADNDGFFCSPVHFGEHGRYRSNLGSTKQFYRKYS